MSDKVRILEVGPRDGLQNQSREIPTAEKLRWIRGLADAGLREIEATSFVHPKWVPQLADAKSLFSELDLNGPVTYSALVPNLRGLETALEVGCTRIAVFTAASESFNQKNINASIAESLERFTAIFDRLGKDSAVSVRGYVSCAFGCPYEGEIDEQAVVDVSTRLIDLGCDELGISDTIGIGTPRDIERVLQPLMAAVPPETVALHLHDTRGTALANVTRGLDLGVRIFDAASGGLGGCPYAPGAAGNLATEDLVFLLEGLGMRTGVDLESLARASIAFEEPLGKELPGRVIQTFR